MRWLGHLSVKLLGILVTAALAGVVGVVLLLSQGPVSLTPFSDFLAARINASLPADQRMAFGQIALQWNAARQRLQLRISDLTVHDDVDTRQFHAPEAALDLDGMALWKGQISIRSAALIAPEILISRTGDGDFTFALAEDAGRRDSSGQAADFWQALSALNRELLPLTAQATLAVERARVRLQDPRAGLDQHIATTSLTFHREQARIDVSGDVMLHSMHTTIPLTVRGQYHDSTVLRSRQAGQPAATPSTQPAMALNVRFRSLHTADIAPLLPLFPDLVAYSPHDESDIAAWLQRISTPLSGGVQIGLQANAALQRLSFTLTGGPGSIDAAPMLPDLTPLQHFHVRADLQPANHDAGIETRLRLRNLSVVFEDEARISGDAVLLADADQPGLIGDFQFSGLNLAHLNRYWPPQLAIPARTWVLENIPSGMVPSGRMQVDAAPERLGQRPLPDDVIAIRFDYEQTEARYWAPLTKIRYGKGNGLITPNAFHLSLDHGRVGDMHVRDGTMKIAGLQQKDQTASIGLVVEGSAADSLALIDRPPLGFSSALGIDPNSVEGQAATRVQLEIPLEYSLQLDDITISAVSTLTDIAAPKVFGDYRLDQGDLNLKADNDRMILRGDAALNNVLLSIRWERTFAPGDTEPMSRYQLSGELDDAARRRLNIDTSTFLRGPARRVMVALESDDQSWVRGTVQADLSDAIWQLPADLGNKTLGAKSDVSFAFTTKAGGELEVQDFSLTGDGIDLLADAAFVSGRLRTASVHRLKTPVHDFHADITAQGDAIDVDLKGPVIDLSDYIGFDELVAQGPGGSDPSATEGLSTGADLLEQSDLQIRISADMEAVKLANGLLLQPGHLSAEITGSKPTRVHLSGALNGKAGLDARLEPDLAALAAGKNGQQITISSADAGGVFRETGLYPNALGGQLKATFQLPAEPGATIHSRVTATNFRIIEAPVLTQILTLGSLTGIRDVVRGDGITFSQLDGYFDITGSRIELKDARAIGPALGLMIKGDFDRANSNVKMSGTLVPAYTLNSVLGGIPLFGKLLVGKQGEGVFALTYRVEGPLEQPSIRINPLSALAPGFLRRIVSGVENALSGEGGDVVSPPSDTLYDVGQ